jgi:predicted Rossmann fold nucleotide-binding protein DprA/Smf involved in DNA uptake
MYSKAGKLYDAEAGPRRNRLMLSENQDALVIAFKGGTGTANCVKIARELKMKILIVS